MGSFLDPDYVSILNLGAIWNFVKDQGSHDLVSEYGVQRVCFKA